ncbi:hypothetical protein ZEAMMB73_Zm00001d035493 [Zea mays]|uniref:Uncharacterized protein n=1 Tax=Zea mays TaxID=4577 RepID=A0A1D6LGU9_MAIZE|nr:hypothetical protein ZEAMMB73_Zm00001d035493 [Zea mays]
MLVAYIDKAPVRSLPLSDPSPARACFLVLGYSAGPFIVQRTWHETLHQSLFTDYLNVHNMDTGDHVAVKIFDKAKVHKKKLAGQVMGSKTRIYMVLDFVMGGELHDIIVGHCFFSFLCHLT